MARLRFNGLTATLGGPLTAADTAVTFGAALTHSGGVAVPTLGSGDYIPLTLLDSSGSVSEIVNLTAYTSGATSGTIARGQEGTTAVTHSAGDKAVHAPTALDIVPGSRFDNPDDPGWAGTLGYDVEFETDDTSGTLPAGWSWVNQGTATYAQQFGAGVLNLPAATATPYQVRGMVRTAPTQATWTMTAKLQQAGSSGDGIVGGLMLRDSSSGEIRIFGALITTPTPIVQRWANATTYGSDLSKATGPGFAYDGYADGVYYRLRKNSATSYTYSLSRDGRVWFTELANLNPATSGAMTVDQIGIAQVVWNNAPCAIAADWLRIR